MKKILTALSVSLLIANFSFAQSDEDALRFSQLVYGSSGRGVGAGSAFGALGGDFSSMTINPAGVAIFQKNQFSFTPSFVSVKNNSLFDGNSSGSHKYNFNVSGFGLVWAKQNDQDGKSKWRNVNFAMGANRVAGFHNSVYWQGYNPSSSLAEKYAELANSSGVSPENIAGIYPFDAGLAYNTSLLQFDSASGYWALPEGGGVKQEQSYKTRGGLTEYLFAFGGNYNDRIYVGGSVSILDANYRYNSSYTETDVNNAIPYFKSFTLDQSQRTTGGGAVMKFGMIARLNDYVRIGGSVASPDFLFLNDNYSASMNTVLDSTYGTDNASSPDGQYSYNITTPWRMNASLALTIKKYGFLSVDYEFLDYSEAFFTLNNDNSTDAKAFENNLNTTISKKYGPAYNIRLGGEGVINDFRIRAGYGLYNTPFQSGVAEPGYDNKITVYSGGIGFNEDDYFLDFGFARSQFNSFLQPYSLASGVNVNGVKESTFSNQFTFTIGWKW